MTQELLNASQVSTTLEEVRGGRVPEPVRPQVGRARYVGQAAVHH